MSTIEVEGLSKSFGTIVAVDRLSFKVGAGEILGILGPNGSGKTTTVRILSCLISPSGGRAYVGGFDIQKDPVRVRESVGVLTETPSLYERLSAYENMDFFARAYGISNSDTRIARIKDVLEFFELWNRRSERVGTYSKGMKQKLAIARAIVHSPEILFLDEPTSGLDPKASKDIRDLMERLSRQEKRTLLLCTHNLEDAEKLCSHVMIINKGRSVVMGTTEELRRRIAGQPKLEIKLNETSDKIILATQSIEGVKNVEADKDSGRLIIELDNAETQTPYVVRSVVENGGLIKSVGLLEPSLEEAYLKLVKEEPQ